MKPKKNVHYIILGLIFLLGLMIGIAVMLLLPYLEHKQTLIDKAASEADIYAGKRRLEINGHFGMHYLVYDSDQNCIAKEVSGFPEMTFEIDTEKYFDRLKDRDVILCYDLIGVGMAPASKRQLSLVAAVPVAKDGETIGVFLLIRELVELPHNLLAFILIWSCLFALLFLFFFLFNKKEQELDRLQRTYIAGMNHELKTPITSIKALSETLLDGYITDPQKLMFYYSTILKEARNLEDTVQKLLELSKLQSTKEMYQKQSVSAAETFTDVLKRYSGLCEDMDIQFLKPDLKNTPLPELYTAPELAARILDLLLHNAVKFTKSGTGQIQVSFDVKRDCLVLYVRDNGCGIPADAAAHIFDRFYQVQNSHNKSGSGLGLSLVREITDGLKEKIWVESEEGKGSTFSFTLARMP